MILTIKVHANSSREKINKINDKEYEIWIKAKPQDNKANTELCKLLKRYLHVKEVRIKSGFTSKIKKVEVI